MVLYAEWRSVHILFSLEHRHPSGVRKIERVCVFVSESVCERERERERERRCQKERESGWERERERVCVCMRERERKSFSLIVVSESNLIATTNDMQGRKIKRNNLNYSTLSRTLSLSLSLSLTHFVIWWVFCFYQVTKLELFISIPKQCPRNKEGK